MQTIICHKLLGLVLLVALAALMLHSPQVGLASVANITRLSVAVSGTQGDQGSYTAAISATGDYVAFSSDATNLVEDDTNNSEDVFVHNRFANTITLVSRASDGTPGNGYSYGPTISADGRYVAFYSSATNLVPCDTNGEDDVFVRDLQTGQTTRVSVASDGTQGNAYSYSPVIARNGRYVTFASAASNLVPGDTNGEDDIFVHDLQTGQTTRVSVAFGGAQADDASIDPVISADGRYVAFTSGASNLVAGDTNFDWDAFVHDTSTGQTVRAITSAYVDSISADGRYVVATCWADDLIAGDTNGVEDIYVRDLQSGQISRASVASDGTQSDDGSYFAAISADGRYVVFTSWASNLVAGDGNYAADVFLHDLQTSQTSRVSLAYDGTEGTGPSWDPAISDDGRYVAYDSGADNIVPGDTNDTFDVFRADVSALPEVVTNAGLGVYLSGTAAITEDRLETLDADNAPAELTYIITSAPVNGTLNLGSTFTQQDINNGLLSYTHNGALTNMANSTYATDSFTFMVTDGFMTGAQYTFDITITVNGLAAGYYEEGNPLLTYNANWDFKNKANASGGIAAKAKAGALVSFWFEGDVLVVLRRIGPEEGDMQVCIDGTCQVVSNYAAAGEWQAPVAFGPFPGGVHQAEISRPADQPAFWFDAVQVVSLNSPLAAGVLAQESHPGLYYVNDWQVKAKAAASGGAVIKATSANAAVFFSFEGTEFTLYRRIGPNDGSMRVCIDGVCQTVSNTSTTKLWGQPVTFDGLSAGRHVVGVYRLPGSKLFFDAVWVGSGAPAGVSNPTVTQEPTELTVERGTDQPNLPPVIRTPDPADDTLRPDQPPQVTLNVERGH